MSDFPSSRLERSSILVESGLKVGASYAGYHLKHALTGKRDEHTKHALHHKNATQVFKDMSRLRGTALKLAQTLSLDNAILPEAYIDVLSQAQYQVPPINRALVRSIIKKELGTYPEEVFESFEADAMAAASIGQVHRARLKDGTPVAVKIQYPNIRDTITSDLSVAKMIFQKLVKTDLTDGYFEEVREKLWEETDYINEGEQLRRFGLRFNNARYKTPVWYSDFSTSKVLTMSYIDGQHLDAFLNDDPPKALRNHFGQLLWDFFHDQITNDYTVYADAHPGNFIFTPDGKLGIIDFGCIKTSPADFFNNYIRLFDVHMKGDTEQIKTVYTNLQMYKPDSDDEQFEAAFFDFCRRFGGLFLSPYLTPSFDFGQKDFESEIIRSAREATTFTDVRGSRHFIYVSRLHIGLYRILMKLDAEVQTSYASSRIADFLAGINQENVLVA